MPSISTTHDPNTPGISFLGAHLVPCSPYRPPSLLRRLQHQNFCPDFQSPESPVLVFEGRQVYLEFSSLLFVIISKHHVVRAAHAQFQGLQFCEIPFSVTNVLNKDPYAMGPLLILTLLLGS